ncbi:MAG: lysine--tRNA ligase [Acholeplasmatales bacterium]|nr:lysine--tRNA ligase [Acholeplasmatales bacterium]
MENLSEQEIVRRNKLEKYKELGIDPFGQRYDVKNHSQQVKDLANKEIENIKAQNKDLNEEDLKAKLHEELEAKSINVSVAGRIMFIRKMGKASFFSIQDKEGKMQIYIRKDVVGDEAYDLFKLADIGDIVGVEGTVMLTQTGEITIKCEKYTHLVKALRPLPEKFHGLQDVEERYRRRYLDLIMNEEAKRVAIQRPRIIRAMQEYFDNEGFIEVETPVLQNIQGGATARPFITHHNALDANFYLRIATELHLKRLLVGGLERVYEIGRIFRNEGMDKTHNPEFTTVELYQAFGDLSSMMDLNEGVIRYAAQKVIGKTTFKNPFTSIENPDELTIENGGLIDISKPFRRVTMCELIKEATGVDFKNNNYTLEEAIAIAKEHKVPVEPHFTVGHVINAFFEEFCEEKLIQPTFLMGHPIEISPLTKKDPNDPRFVQRFELFIGGKEFSNAYTELNDPIDQRERFEEQMKEKAKGNDEANEMDVDFCESLEYGMPPAGGIGIGIDRLVIFLTESTTIRDVILFPQMKTR